MSPQPISKKKQPAKGGYCAGVFLGIFGLVFFGAGSFALWALAIQPVIQWNRAKTWEEVPCKIMSSTIEVDHTDDGTSYTPVVTYQYRVDGVEHLGDQISFGVHGTKGYARRTVDQFPKGADRVCFYDPEDPGNSVLNRDWPLSFWILFPVPFLMVGMVAIYFAIFGNLGSANQKSMYSTLDTSKPFSTAAFLGMGGGSGLDEDELDKEWDRPQKLKPDVSKIQRLLVSGGICIFWNSIVSVFVFNVFEEDGGFKICLGLFLVPFVIVGIGMILYFFHSLLSMANPNVEIAMSTGAVPLGGSFDIAWEFQGSVRRIRKLEIKIVGTESTTYRRGTSTYTDTEDFCKIVAVETQQNGEMPFGSVNAAIPAETMHSFSAGGNEIKWTVQVRADIPFWPDVAASFPFRVTPSKS